MANKALLERIKRLESRKNSAAYKPDPPIPLSWYVVAYFGGHYDGMASPCEAYYKALGLTRAIDFESLTPEQQTERHAKAWHRILRKRKVDPATLAPGEAVMKMLKKLNKAGIVPAESWIRDV